MFQAALSGRRKWGLSDWAHLVTLVAAQFAGARSLRDLVAVLAHHRGALAHLGLGGAAVARSTLAEANRDRPSAPFEAVAAQLSAEVAQRARGLGREAQRLIDATRLHAGKAVRGWAVDGAVKLHLVFDPATGRSTYFAVTPARINDITAARQMPIEPGATYVFDRGYYDFGFWARLQAAGCRFVTRLKANTPLTVLRTRRLPQAARHIRSDRIATLPNRLAASRQNPYPKPVRIIEVEISTGRLLTLVSSDLRAPATEIAALYQQRWQIELFFKWLKQNLRLSHFLGRSRNAITLQVIAALIAFLLARLAELRGRSRLTTQELFRLLQATFLQRRPLAALLANPPAPQPIPPPNPQLTLAFP